jgi:hypothetical protein
MFIPHEYLLKNLIVHDPWNLLAVDAINRHGLANFGHSDVDWERKEDITHKFHLSLSRSAETSPTLNSQPSVEMDNSPKSVTETKKIEIMDAQDMRKLLYGYVIKLPPDSTPPGPIQPPFAVAYRPPPTPPAPPTPQMHEAHLYLSPAYKIGEGHHSIVLQGEWELPRDALVPPSHKMMMCGPCMAQEAERILAENDWVYADMVGKLKDKTTTLKRILVSDKTCSNADGANVTAIGVDCSKLGATYRSEVEGPVYVIRTSVAWQDHYSPTCKHLVPQIPPPAPPTVKVHVVAKLSLCGDRHLRREANNYQRFPQRMFEHWSGFHKLQRLTDPVPVGALVPKFYGYYEPEARQRGDYLSPILLMEYCGRDISPETLSVNEQYVDRVLRRYGCLSSYILSESNALP